MAKYVEIVPPPAEVDLVFYRPDDPHIAVAPASHHEDGGIVGVTYTGLNKELTYVRLGDAVITYPDGTIVVWPRDKALSYFAPKREELPALPAAGEDAETLAEATGARKRRPK